MPHALQALLKLPAEKILLRWFNYHLAASGAAKRIENFGKDLHDSEAYALLLQQIDPTRQCSSSNPSPSPSPSPDRCVVLSEGAALVDKAKEKVAWQLSSAIVSAPIGGLLEPTPSGWTVHEERDHEAANMGRRSSSPG